MSYIFRQTLLLASWFKNPQKRPSFQTYKSAIDGALNELLEMVLSLVYHL